MSTRSQFRSNNGCCICGTKSSSSRFSNSSRFCQYFSKCFGPKGEGRTGDICNACVLYVKRWCKGSDQMTGKYEKVLDKKKGPGLKHITQIVKMQQRQQARLNAFGGHGMETRSKLQKSERRNSPLNSTGYYYSSDGDDSRSSMKYTNQDDSICSDYKTGCSASNMMKECMAIHQQHAYHNCNKSGGSSTSTRSFTSFNSSICSSSSSGFFNSITGCVHDTNNMNLNNQHTSKSEIMETINNVSVSNNVNGSTNNNGLVSGTNNLVIGSNLQQNDVGSNNINVVPDNLDALSQDSMETGDVFRVPQPCSTRAKNYKKRVQMKPVKLPNADEVDNLLREIMARNSQVVNFEIPLAMQNHLRLRNRVIKNNNVSGGNSNNDQGSVSSDSFGSSVGNVDLLRN